MLRTSITALLLSIACNAATIDQMTLEEKLGQILMVHVHGEEANQEAKTLICDLHIGGIIYYNWSNSLDSPEQIQTLSKGLQQLSMESPHKIPLLIATDQEGGLVTRLTKGFTIFPGNKALGMTGNPELAKQSALVMGQEMIQAGINLNLSPVVDINNNPKNPMIGIRSFGETPENVTSFGRNAIEGFHQAKILTTLKHFPGHGDVEIDSHEALPCVHKSKEDLWKMEFLPFFKLAKETDLIMTGHIMVPSIDPVNCATLSPQILGILRNEIGFNGVIISDSLVMEGLLKNCASIDDAAIRAFNAGCDIVLLGGKQLIGARNGFELTVSDIKRIQKSMISAVQNKEISLERINQSVERILKLKEKIPASHALPSLAVQAELSKQIANLALKVIKGESSHSKRGTIAVIAPQILLDNLQSTSFLAGNPRTFFFKDLNPTKEEIQAAKASVRDVDMVICFSYNAWKNTDQTDLFHGLIDLDKPVYLIAVRDSLDVTLFPDAECILATFSPTAPSLEAAYQKIQELQTKDAEFEEEYNATPHTL